MTFLCVITPVFDECLESFQVLVKDIQQQTFNDFIHVSISDGKSTLIENFISSLKDDKFIYVETPPTNPHDRESRFYSIMSRRNYGLQNFEAIRYVFLDADLKICATDYFQTLYEAHQKHSNKILITKLNVGVGVFFPKFPIKCGGINISNYCFTAEMARLGYPTDLDRRLPYANDFRFFKKIEPFGYVLLKFVSGIKDGNKKYKNLCEY
jgi:hypothetical protein